jgi:Uma2 family endonuclease
LEKLRDFQPGRKV